MDLVIDANILFSILIKIGKTEELFFEEDLHLFAPEFLFEEFEKYKELILEKTERTKEKFAKTNFPQKLQTSHEEHFENSSKKEGNQNYSNFSKEEFSRLITILKKRIKTIPNEETDKFLPEAKKVSPDPKDADYFAISLKMKCPLWSNDKTLKLKQKIVKIYSTEDLAKIFF